MRSILAAAAIAFAFSLFLTPVFLRLFRKWGWGQVIRDPDNVHNPSHPTKRGTPTMGGTIFIVGSILGYLIGGWVGGNPPTISGLLVIWLMVGFGVVGFVDDYMKVKQQRSLGLSGWRKIVGQMLVLVPFAIVALNFPNDVGQTPASPYVSLFRDIEVLSFFIIGPVLGWLLYLAWVSVIGVATSNGANLSDGLDGLASGAAIMVVGIYSVISFWQFSQRCEGPLPTAQLSACYSTRDPFDLAIISAAFVGALVGFLWWNAPKAKVFMGDVGSMSIGGVIAGMAILTRTELMLVLVAGVFIIAPGSVILQRIYFKLTRGKRLFLMSPLHHHLEMRGWSETTIVVRMWIIAGMSAMVGMGLFYVEWISRT